jgi:hypothetical protein
MVSKWVVWADCMIDSKHVGELFIGIGVYFTLQKSELRSRRKAFAVICSITCHNIIEVIVRTFYQKRRVLNTEFRTFPPATLASL